MDKKISSAVIHRMPRYFRHLCDLQDAGITRISSGTLAERMGLTASQVRQDFNCFGGFGQQGYGYNVAELRAAIAGIMRIDRDRRAIIVGAGNLGKALMTNFNFTKYGVRLVAAFDSNPLLIGTEIAGVPVYSGSAGERPAGDRHPHPAQASCPGGGAAAHRQRHQGHLELHQHRPASGYASDPGGKCTFFRESDGAVLQDPITYRGAAAEKSSAAAAVCSGAGQFYKDLLHGDLGRSVPEGNIPAKKARRGANSPGAAFCFS